MTRTELEQKARAFLADLPWWDLPDGLTENDFFAGANDAELYRIINDFEEEKKER